MLKVSIIVPIYNTEKYLKKCLDSLVNQTLKDIEIILVNDGSLDNSGKIADMYSTNDCRIKVIHKKNGGLSSARNTGLKCATGMFIGFVDSDDWVAEDTYEIMYNTAIQDELDIVSCAAFNVFENQIVPSLETKDIYIDLNEITISEFGIKHFRNFSTSACNKIYRRDIIDKYRLKFLNNKVVPSEDQVFNIMFLVHANKIRLLSNRFYYCVRHYGSITTTKKKDPAFVMNMVSMATVIKEYVEKNGQNIDQWLPFLYYNFLMSGLGNIEKNGVKDVAKQLSIVSEDQLFEECFVYLSKPKNYDNIRLSKSRKVFTLVFSKLLSYNMFYLSAIMQVFKRKRLDIKNSGGNLFHNEVIG